MVMDEMDPYPASIVPSTEALRSLSNEQRSVVESFLASATRLTSVTAIVVGGSHARSSARADSDVDLALYYRTPFSVERLTKIANLIATTPPTVTDFYEWGLWVNGGAWIQTAAGKLDLLYRNLDHVTKTIDEAHRGIFHHDYLQQPSFDFSSIVYLAETQYCRPLFDQTGILQQLKQRVATYPPALRTRVVRSYSWTAEFTLVHAKDFARRGDTFNTVGCLGRIVYFLIHVLFALNESYYFGDKGSIEALTSFPLQPANTASRITAALAVKSTEPNSLVHSVSSLEALFQEIIGLAGATF
jgi:Domain of unknown function (DUF4037)/Nucleotidyltransferase domain